MSAKKYIDVNNDEVPFTITSAGAADDGKGVGLDPTGRLDASTMPVGVGPSKRSVIASEALTAGMFVNFWDNAGTINMRKTDATSNAKPAHAFVLHDVVLGVAGDAYMVGNINTAMSGLTPGADYWLDRATPGGVTNDTSAYTGGNIVQYIGVALSATELVFGNPSFKLTA